MATKTVGATGRQYATITLWEAYLDGIGTLTEQEIGECYNDASPSFNEYVTFSGYTAASAKEAILRPASGQGFRDTPANKLFYATANGVSWTNTTFGTYRTTCNIETTYTQVFGMQISAGSSVYAGVFRVVAANSLMDSCIAYYTGTNSSENIFNATNGKCVNSLFIIDNADDFFSMRLFNTKAFYGCTIARTSNNTPVNPMLSDGGYNTVLTLKNTAIFGSSTNAIWTVAAASVTYLATERSDFPEAVTGEVLSVAHTTATFVQPANTNGDYKLVAGSALIGVGVADATNTPVDIFGTTRADPPCIGCFELIAAGGIAIPVLTRQYRARWAA
jgi:hypothetical protein